jgi:hypothetical protein
METLDVAKNSALLQTSNAAHSIHINDARRGTE